MRRCILGVLTWVVVLGAGSVYADQLYLVKDGKPQGTIVLADGAGNYQKWAAQWLRDYVKRASGATLPIVTEGKAPAGALISVGHTKMAARAGLTTDDLKYDGCKLLVKGNVLYLIGRDAAFSSRDKRPSPWRGGAQGTIRAVTTFLEDVVGVRWLVPGPEGTFIPQTKDISVPSQFSKTFIPAIAYCDGKSPYRDPAANYANGFRVAMRYLGRGGHSWEVHIGDKYFETHPKYFALLPTGERSRATYNKDGQLTRNSHLCTSNPDVRRIMVEKIRAEFDQGYDMVQIGQSDGWQPCVCPECMKMDSHRAYATITREKPCEKIWLMHKWILDELYKSHPNKLVNVLVYGPTKWPSKRFDSLPPNAVTEMAPMTGERLEAWRGKIRKLTTYLYWWEDNCNATGFVPAPSPEWLQKTLRRYRVLHVMGIKGTPRINWGLGGPTYYAYGKLMGDPDADIDKLLHDYCVGLYEEAGPAMKRFFKLFHSRSSHTRELPYITHSYPAENAYVVLYPARVVQELDRLLKRAESKAKSERAKEWVKHTRDCFDGLKVIAEMFAAKRFFELEPTREHLLRVKRRVEAFETWRARILSYEKTYTDRWFPAYWCMAGHLMTGGSNAAYDRYYYGRHLVLKDLEALRKGEKSVRGYAIGGNLGHNEIAAPIAWDFDRILANLGKPRAEKVINAVRTARPPVLDGRVDAAWEGARPQRLEPHLSELGVKITDGAVTTVRLMYDDKCLYAAYECIEPAIEDLVLKSVGRDGDCWHCDEVELFLNIDENSQRKSMQFVAVPIENAFYDARKGFITDELHPDYSNWEVGTWNPKWRYAGYIDKRAKKWFVEIAIPYKSIGAVPPTPGTEWRGNFARCRRVGRVEDLTSWAPETFGSEPQYFGKIVFLGPGEKATRARPEPRKATRAPTSARKEPEKNFIANGDFEATEMYKGVPPPWGVVSSPPEKRQEAVRHCTVETDKSHGKGKCSLKIDFTDLDDDKGEGVRSFLFYQFVDKDGRKELLGKKVVFSFWVYYNDMSDLEGGWFPGPFLGVAAFHEGKSVSGETICLSRKYFADLGYVSAVQMYGKWIKIEKRMVIPPECDILKVSLGMYAWRKQGNAVKINRTSLCIDDISLKMAEGEDM